MDFRELLPKLQRMWDPRATLAKEWLDSATRYEERMRANKLLDQQIVESILHERSRIHALFQKLLPEFKEQLSVVVTNETLAETVLFFHGISIFMCKFLLL